MKKNTIETNILIKITQNLSKIKSYMVKKNYYFAQKELNKLIEILKGEINDK